MASRSSSGRASDSSARSSSVGSDRQHRQPPLIDMAASTCPDTRKASTLMSPKSLITTPIRPAPVRRRWLSRVVLPLPSEPNSAITGMRAWRALTSSSVEAAAAQGVSAPHG